MQSSILSSESVIQTKEKCSKYKLHPSDDPNHFRSSTIFKTIVAGIGFMCDAYDLFIMSLIIVVLSFDFEESNSDKSLISTAVLVGSVVGQIIFGIIADYLGRRQCFIATLSLLIIGASMSAGAFSTENFSIFYSLAIARAILGIGIGGEYPLSATVTSEANNEPKGRGRRIAAVFSMQSLGAVLAPALVTLVLACTSNIQLVWRFCLGAGGIPAICMLYFRFTMKESESFVQSHGEDTTLADANKHKWRDLKFYSTTLMGTSGSWFIFDVVFYANGFFSATILSSWYPTPNGDDVGAVHSFLFSVALSTLYLSIISLPGYWIATLLIDRIGRRKLQLGGFIGMVVIYVLCGVNMAALQQQEGLFYFLYGLSFFFSQGANVATFVVPSEVFPTTIRASCHGISAAFGKLGAITGAAIMPTILSSSSLTGVMYVSAGISTLGLIWTLLFTPETMDKPLPQSDKFMLPPLSIPSKDAVTNNLEQTASKLEV